MELLKKSHTREMDKLKRSSGDGGDGLQTEVVQLQVEMENMSLKYMEEIENLKVCCVDSRPLILSPSAPSHKWRVISCDKRQTECYTVAPGALTRYLLRDLSI